MTPDIKIDIVYLWVDDSDKKWRAQKDKWLEIIKGEKPVSNDASTNARWRDNGEFLYSLRSVDKFAPWVNHIYIITGFNQVPRWLNIKHPKITIVPHEQIMPHDALPTFNSVAIEMCIPNIPGLSEHFLLMNDDMFFNRPLTPDFFYDARGRARILYSTHAKHDKNIGTWMTQVDEYTQTLILAAKSIDKIFGKSLYKYRPAHSIDPYIKSSWIECRNHPLLTGHIDKQIRNKFRTNNELQRWLFNLYDLISVPLRCTTIELSGIVQLVSTQPAPTTQFLPIVVFFSITVLAPIQDFSPIWTFPVLNLLAFNPPTARKSWSWS